MLYIAKCAAALRERSSPFRDVQENSGGRKNEEKIYGTCTCGSYDSIHDKRMNG